MSLEGKFTITALSFITLAVIISSWLIFDREEKLYRANLLQQANILSETSRLSLTNILVYNELNIIDDQDMIDYFDYFILSMSERDARIRDIVILDTVGRVVTHKDIASQSRFHKDEVFGEVMRQNMPVIKEPADKTGNLVITAPLNVSTKQWGAIRIELSQSELHSRIENLRNEVVSLTIVIIAVAMLLVKYFAVHLTRPLLKLIETMDEIQNHRDIKITPSESRNDEIGKLEKSFYWFLKRLKETDIEREKTCERLVQNEKLVSIGYLAAGVAHEINNPLGGVILCFNRLTKHVDNNHETGQLIMGIDDSLRKMKHTIEQLLDFSKTSKISKSLVDINAVIKKLLILVEFEALRQKIEIKCELEKNLPPLMLNENKMSQVVLNIMINAFQAMPDGGSLFIKTYQTAGSECAVSFRDTGKGIPADIFPYIFDPFFSTKESAKGTGLGLSVSKGIIEEHGGVIDVSSTAGRGTVFTITLPSAVENSGGKN